MDAILVSLVFSCPTPPHPHWRATDEIFTETDADSAYRGVDVFVTLKLDWSSGDRYELTLLLCQKRSTWLQRIVSLPAGWSIGHDQSVANEFGLRLQLHRHTRVYGTFCGRMLVEFNAVYATFLSLFFDRINFIVCKICFSSLTRRISDKWIASGWTAAQTFTRASGTMVKVEMIKVRDF